MDTLEIEGIPPIIFKGNGKNLLDYRIWCKWWSWRKNKKFIAKYGNNTNKKMELLLQ